MPSNVPIKSSNHPFSSIRMDYMVHDVDDTNDTKYYGLLNNIGQWYITKEVTSEKTYRYCVGKSNYPTNWTNRASLTYNYWNLVI